MQHDLWSILGVVGVVVCVALRPVIAACIRHDGAIAAVRCSSNRFAVGGAGLAQSRFLVLIPESEAAICTPCHERTHRVESDDVHCVDLIIHVLAHILILHGILYMLLMNCRHKGYVG